MKKTAFSIVFSFLISACLSSCCNCEEPVGEDLESNEHNYSEKWTYDSEYHWHKCVDEGYTDLITEKVAHIWDESKHQHKDSTCTVSGYDIDYCKDCGYKKRTNYALLDHNYKSTINGNICCKKCESCGTEINTGVHNYSDVVTKTPATYDKDGLVEKTCPNCGDTIEETVDKLVHNFYAGYQRDENYHWKQCSDTGFENLQIEKEEHDFEEVTSSRRPATCTQEGIAKYVCKKCGYVEYEDLNMVDHSYGDFESNEFGHWRTCTECGDNTVLENHIWDESKHEHVDSTCSIKGYDKDVCSVCGYTSKKDLSLNDHTYSSESNMFEHWEVCKADGCGHIKEDSKHEHNFVEDEDGLTETCSICNFSRKLFKINLTYDVPTVGNPFNYEPTSVSINREDSEFVLDEIFTAFVVLDDYYWQDTDAGAILNEKDAGKEIKTVVYIGLKNDAALDDYAIKENGLYNCKVFINGKESTNTLSSISVNGFTNVMDKKGYCFESIIKNENSVEVKVDYDGSMGSVTGAGVYYHGDTVILKATPNEGYQFDGWTIGLDTILTSTYEFTITNVNDGLLKITANFAEIHVHSFENKADMFQHWIGCSGDGCNEIDGEKVDHTFVTDEGGLTETCSVCNFTRKIFKVYLTYDVPQIGTKINYNPISVTTNQPCEDLDLEHISTYFYFDGVYFNEAAYIFNSNYLGQDITVNACIGIKLDSNGDELAFDNDGLYNVEVYINGELATNDFKPHKYSNNVLKNNLGYSFTSVSLGTVEAPKRNIAVTYDESKGTVTGAGEYSYGDTVTLIATPNEGYYLYSVKDDEGKSLGFADSRYIFTATEKNPCDNYTFEFVGKSINLDFSCDYEKGSISSAGNYICGEEITATATPKYGYEFAGWYVNDELVSENAEYTFICPSEETTYVAKFEPKVSQLTVYYDFGDGTTSEPQYYECAYGETFNLEAPTFENYVFDGWYFYSSDLNRFFSLSKDQNYSYQKGMDDETVVAKYLPL